MPFAVKDTFVYLVIVAFFTYVNPSHAYSAKLTSDVLEEVASLMEDLKMTVTDDEGKSLDVRDFAIKPPSSFTLRSEESGKDLKIKVKLGSLSHTGFSYSLVAQNGETDKVLSRRTVVLDSRLEVKSSQLKVMQTSRSMQLEIAKKWEPSFGHATPWTKYKLAFQNLFGISDAHASDAEAIVGTIAILALVLAGTLAIVAIVVFWTDILIGRSTSNPKILELSVAALVSALLSGALALVAASIPKIATRRLPAK